MRNLILSLTLLFFLAPAAGTLAQEISPEGDIIQLNETAADKKKEAEKKKDVIEINAAFFINLGINITTVLIIILLIYFPSYHKLDYIFTFIMFNIVIFVLTYVLNEVKISMGAAFGLFAVFSMLRYRTEGISMKDMTYLFMFIAVGLISAIQLEYYELMILSAIIILATYIIDGNVIFRREYMKRVDYENIDLIVPERRDELMADLRKRTGLDIHRIVIRRINFLRDIAVIMVYYYNSGKSGDSVK